MPHQHITKLPALLAFVFLLGIPATGCAAHPPHRTVITYQVHKAPPPARREVVVAKPARGHVWVAGHYVWKPGRRSYVWVAGKWTRPPRAGAVWVAPRYERRGGRTVYVAGYWKPAA